MYSFIFSRDLRPRLARHLAFWGLYALCTIPLQLTSEGLHSLADRSTYERALADMLAFLPVYLFSVYFSLYFILPRYLATRKRSSLIWRILFLLTVSMVAGYFISYFLIELEHAGSQSSWTSVLALAMHRCHANLTTITIIAVLIKIMKDDYYRQREHEMLAVENLANRLRLLKLQLHPRVLFSSLDSIYAEMEKGSSRAPRMILKLSDLLSYLLYRSDGERIPLSSEVEMIGNYIQLKKLQYPDRMDIHLYSDDIRIDHLVPPGLFLPILEIGMEPPDDGRKPVTVEIGVSTSSSKVYFSMTNNRRGLDALQASAARLALEQLRARLQSLLSGKFRLNVEPGPEDLLISMELGIDKPVKTRQ